MLDGLIDMKPLLRKKLNKSNIPQKPDFILGCERDQKLSLFPAAEEPIIKAIYANNQKRKALSAKNPQRQVQNSNIFHKKTKETQKVTHEPKNKVYSHIHSLSSVYNNNSARLAIYHSFTK